MNQHEFIVRLTKYLKLTRVEYGFTQEEMAQFLGLSKKTLVETEKGRRNLSWTECIAFTTLFSGSALLQNEFGGELSDMVKAYAFSGKKVDYPRTLGGKIWWKTIRDEKGYRIQQNIVSAHFRILDSQDGRIMSTFSQEEADQFFAKLTNQ